jgi:twitching motility protein PilU
MHRQVWMDLSLNLKSMVAQQLIPRKDGKGRTPVVEVLLNTPLVADYIRKGEVHLIKELMTKSTELGMQTLDQSLVLAYKSGLISSEDALRHADSTNDVRLQIKMLDKKTRGGAASATEELGLTFEQRTDKGQFIRR